MDKRMEENQRVKTQIRKAFFKLLKKKKEEDISVTEITRQAGVSRMAYYRNFSSKRDIVDDFLCDTLWEDLKSMVRNDCELFSPEYGLSYFRLMKKYKDAILLLDACGYGSLILAAFNGKNEEIAGDMPANSLSRYKLYYAAGGFYNVAIIWLKEGCRETPEEMLESFNLFVSQD